MEVFSNWGLIRLSGFLAYFLFTFSISFGLMSKFAVFKKNKPLMNALHQTSGWTGFLTVIFHAILVSRDNFITYHLGEIFVPFSSDYARIESGFGTVSFYLFLVVIGTSDFLMKKLGRRFWENIHLLVIPAWILMVLHGVFIGTDSNEPWAAFLYGGGVFLVLILLSFRHFEGKSKVFVPKNSLKR